MARLKSDSVGLPVRILKFADTFIELQQRRNEADYDPTVLFDEAFVRNYVGDAERAIAAFNSESIEAQRAFAIFVALKSKTR